MNTQHTPISLHAGQVMTLPNSRDHWLLVLQGRVWLTQSGDADDHFLQAGQRLLLGNHGDVVIEADGGEPACCSLQHAWASAGRASEGKVPAKPADDKAPAKAAVGRAPAKPAVGKAPIEPAVAKAAGRRISPA